MLRIRRLSLLVVAASALLALGPDQETPSGSRLAIFADGPASLIPGAPASYRVIAYRLVGLMRTEPADARCQLVLRRDTQEATLYDGATGNVAFTPPAWDEGPATLVIRLAGGDAAAVEQQVSIRRSTRVLLTTDKPLYQPLQVIHLRALALQEGSLSPIGDTEITFEVEDSRGNKVFKQRQTTNAFGVAAADFQLADEVNEGEFRLRAIVGNAQTEKTVDVRHYVLPKFRVDVETDRPYYEPGQTIRGTFNVQYFFGKPVEGGSAIIHAFTFDTEFHEFAQSQAHTDDAGRGEFTIELPQVMTGTPLENGQAIVKIAVEVTDTADHKETKEIMRTVTTEPLTVVAIPEGAKVVPDLENRVWVVVAGPDGTPVQADVTLTVADQHWEAATNDAGYASVTMTPQRAWIQQTGYRQPSVWRSRWRDYGYEPTYSIPLTVHVRAQDGREIEKVVQLNCDAEGDAILARPDRAMYRAGQAMDVEVISTMSTGVAFVDVVRSGRTHVTSTVTLENGRGHFHQDIPTDLFGTTEIQVYLVKADGTIARDTRVVYIQPAEELQIHVSADQETYRPAQEATIRFEVVGGDGRGVQAALGLIIVDEAVYALSEMQPGLEKVYFTLERELAQPRYQIKPGGRSFAEVIVEPEAVEEARGQEIAQILLAGVEVDEARAPRVVVNQVEESYVAANQQADQLLNAVATWVQQGREFSNVSGSGERAVVSDLLDRIANDPEYRQWNLQQVLSDPFGGRWSIASLAQMRPELTVRNLAHLQDAQKLAQFAQAVNQRALFQDLVHWDAAANSWRHQAEEWEEFLRAGAIPDNVRRTAFGEAWTWTRLAESDPFFAADNLARYIRYVRASNLFNKLLEYSRSHTGVFVRDAQGALVYAPDAIDRLGLTEAERCDLRRQWTLAALAEDYPEFSPETLANSVDAAKMQDVWRAIVRAARNVPPAGLIEIGNGQMRFRDGAVDALIREGGLTEEQATSVRGGRVDPNTMGGGAIVNSGYLTWAIYAGQFRHLGRLICDRLHHQGGAREMTDAALAAAVETDEDLRAWTTDPWGHRIAIQDAGGARNNFAHSCNLLRRIYLVSSGPDGQPGTGDEIIDSNCYWNPVQLERMNFYGQPSLTTTSDTLWGIQGQSYGYGDGMENEELGRLGAYAFGLRDDMRRFRGGLAAGSSAAPMSQARRMATADALESAEEPMAPGPVGGEGGGGGSRPPPRIREYFPETLYWNPALITDEQGRAEITLPMADSITTWRLTASANAMNGMLGGTTSPIRVFQPFFADIDFPVALTQNDVVRIPVAVYNYLPERQEVRLVAHPEDGFELVDDEAEKRVTLDPEEVRAVYFRLRASEIGRRTFLVEAYGSGMDDAIRRSVDVLPDGKMFETVINDRLSGEFRHSLPFPAEAIDGSCRCFFKLYPGVFAQVCEGVEGMLTTPHG